MQGEAPLPLLPCEAVPMIIFLIVYVLFSACAALLYAGLALPFSAYPYLELLILSVVARGFLCLINPPYYGCAWGGPCIDCGKPGHYILGCNPRYGYCRSCYDLYLKKYDGEDGRPHGPML